VTPPIGRRRHTEFALRPHIHQIDHRDFATTVNSPRTSAGRPQGFGIDRIPVHWVIAPPT
jgi:hypothetical protein